MEDFKITEAELWEYISKKADDKTIQKVEDWMRSTNFDEGLFIKLTAVYEHSSMQNPSVENAKKRFFKEVKPKKAIWKNILKYAAMLAIILSGTYFYKNIYSTKNKIFVQTTFGEQKSIELSDGSKVWLNALSKLSYDSKTPRTLYLEGEAFFEVVKDSLHPFTVTTLDDITIKALGTSFNVRSYKEGFVKETKLLTGKVQVYSNTQFKEKVILIPNEKATFDKKAQKIIKSQMEDNESKIAWREGEIEFENKTFEAIAIDLQVQFGKQIRFKNEEIKKTRFTGSFNQKTTINEIFEILKISKEFTYKLNTETNEWMIK